MCTLALHTQAFILRAQEHCCKYQTDSRELTDCCTAGKCNQDMTSALCPRAFFIDYTFKGGYVYMQCPPLEHCGTKKCWWWIDRCHHKMRTTGKTSSCGQELMMTTDTTNAFIWDKTCNNLLSFETPLFFLLTSNRQTALWVRFYEIHTMLLGILDVISKRFCESTEFSALGCLEIQRWTNEHP